MIGLGKYGNYTNRLGWRLHSFSGQPALSLVVKTSWLQRRQFSQDHLRTPLTPQQQELYNKEVLFLNRFLLSLEKLDARKEDISSIKQSINQLKDLFLLVVVGEFNSGKSSFLNALLGSHYLKGGPTPTTCKIDTIRYGLTPTTEDVSSEERTIRLPVEWLKEISLVDTPGTNAVFKFHQALTEHFLPRSDLVLWVTSVDRAFSESERQFLEQVKELRKKVLIVLSKIDIMEDDSQVKEVEDFVSQQFKQHLLDSPPIFPVSAKFALQSKLDSAGKAESYTKSNQWKLSRFGDLEGYLFNTLTSVERTSLKFKNPLGLVEHLVNYYEKEIDRRQKITKKDLELLNRIELELIQYKKELSRDFVSHSDRIDNVLLRLSEKAKDFISSKVTITNVIYLMNSDKIKLDFEEHVVGNSSKEIEKYINDLVDWGLEKNSRQWGNIVDKIQSRANSLEGEMIGKPLTMFEYNRTKIIDDLCNSTGRILVDFDRKKEAENLTNTIKSGLVQTAVAVGGVTLGSILYSSILDPTGMVAVGTVAALGFSILPLKRKNLLNNLTTNIEEMRKKLRSTLEDHFSQQIESNISKMKSNISPFTNWVNEENKKTVGQTEEIHQIKKELTVLLLDIDTIHYNLQNQLTSSPPPSK